MDGWMDGIGYSSLCLYGDERFHGCIYLCACGRTNCILLLQLCCLVCEIRLGVMGRDVVVGRGSFEFRCYCFVSVQIIRKPDSFDVLCYADWRALV
jgi:hypothetical protein